MKPKSKFMQTGWEQGKVLNQNDHNGLDYLNWMFNMNIDDELTFDW
jgi:hypothetical protein